MPPPLTLPASSYKTWILDGLRRQEREGEIAERQRPKDCALGNDRGDGSRTCFVAADAEKDEKLQEKQGTERARRGAGIGWPKHGAFEFHFCYEPRRTKDT